MNERIKELAERSVSRFDLDMDGSMDLDQHGRWVRYDDLANLAELIIRECSAVVFKNIGPRSALDVLEHFELKE